MDRPTGVDNPFARKTGWGRLGQQAVPITPEPRSWAAPARSPVPPARPVGILTGSALPTGENLRSKARVAPGVLTGSALPPPRVEEVAPVVAPEAEIQAPAVGAATPRAIPLPRAADAQGARNLLIAAGAVVFAGAGLATWLFIPPATLKPDEQVGTAQAAPLAPVVAPRDTVATDAAQPAERPVRLASSPARRAVSEPVRTQPVIAPLAPPVAEPVRIVVPPPATVVAPAATSVAQPMPAVPPPTDPDAQMATRTPGG